VINTPMLHSSFLNTVQAKWGANAPPGAFAPLTARQRIGQPVHRGVHGAAAASRKRVAGGARPAAAADLAGSAARRTLDELGRSIVEGTEEMLKRQGLAPPPATARDQERRDRLSRRKPARN
jgi:hypothetical protein